MIVWVRVVFFYLFLEIYKVENIIKLIFLVMFLVSQLVMWLFITCGGSLVGSNQFFWSVVVVEGGIVGESYLFVATGIFIRL